MKAYKAQKGISSITILSVLILINVSVIFLNNFLNVYVVISLLKLLLFILDVYGVYYMLLSLTLKYIVDEENLYIIGIWGLKKVKIPFENIEGYKTSNGKINAVKLYGIGNNKFAFGRYVIEKIGTTRMFITSTKNVFYIKTNDINYAISPENLELFKNTLEKNKIEFLDWSQDKKKSVSLHKDRCFMIPFIIVSLIIIMFTLTPLVLYLNGTLPDNMPLSFDSKFNPVRMGTDRQFAFKQATYGVLNMAVLFCMYYAAHFHAKYDRNSAKIYMYISLLISVMFFLMQIKTLFNFMV